MYEQKVITRVREVKKDGGDRLEEERVCLQ